MKKKLQARKFYALNILFMKKDMKSFCEHKIVSDLNKIGKIQHFPTINKLIRFK